MTKLIVGFHKFANAPENRFFTLSVNLRMVTCEIYRSQIAGWCSLYDP
jgi:hypothetical protein